MLLDDTTPVVLTLDEAVNIERVLEAVSWAKDIVVVDSGSSDGTLEIVSSFPNARVFQRDFDSHANQWNFAIESTGIRSDWILALDADHIVSDELVEELAALSPPDNVSGYRVNFRYCVYGRPLRASLYPPLVSIFRRGHARYVQQGHTQRLVVDGPVAALAGSMMHDDRKSFGRWVVAQNRYMRLEADLIRETSWSSLSASNRLRSLIVPAPFVALVWCLFVKRTVLDGLPGVAYGIQRMIAEFILSFHLLLRLHR